MRLVESCHLASLATAAHCRWITIDQTPHCHCRIIAEIVATFSAPVQNLAAQFMCRGTWTDQIVPGTRWNVILRYEGRGYGVLCSQVESQITVVWDVIRCGSVSGVPRGRGFGVFNPPPKFRSFDKAAFDCKLSGKCLVFLFQHPN